jgi:hypothetical protein
MRVTLLVLSFLTISQAIHSMETNDQNKITQKREREEAKEVVSENPKKPRDTSKIFDQDTPSLTGIIELSSKNLKTWDEITLDISRPNDRGVFYVMATLCGNGTNYKELKQKFKGKLSKKDQSVLILKPRKAKFSIFLNDALHLQLCSLAYPLWAYYELRAPHEEQLVFSYMGKKHQKSKVALKEIAQRIPQGMGYIEEKNEQISSVEQNSLPETDKQEVAPWQMPYSQELVQETKAGFSSLDEYIISEYQEGNKVPQIQTLYNDPMQDDIFGSLEPIINL